MWAPFLDEWIRKDETMVKIPIVIARFLALPETREFSIHDKFAYLIKSVDGDDYYLCEHLPDEGFISKELGCGVYEIVTKNVDYGDVFNWYREWVAFAV